MTTDQNLTKARHLIKRALEVSADKERYARRLRSYPTLTKLGFLPSKVEEVIDERRPELFHALAFRMATYSDWSENLFTRWENLLKSANNAKGWNAEYGQWNKSDHWAKRWDKFNQFLWLLQCFEYFSNNGREISFPYAKSKAKPDLCVKLEDGTDLYVECYFITKWWGREHLVNGLLWALDPNLTLRRTYNISYAPPDNPFLGKDESTVVESLAKLSEALAPEKLETLREKAKKASPQLVCKIGSFSVLLKGVGHYQPNTGNAHGDQRISQGVYVNEIIQHKANSNGLNCHRPNLVMVNGLGQDFQFGFEDEACDVKLPDTLDEIRLHTCGIDEKIGQCNLRAVLPRNP